MMQEISSPLTMTPFVKLTAKLFGILAIIAGIAGFFITNMLGMEMNPIRNVLFVVIGMLGINMSATYGKARLFLMVFGLLFGVIAIMSLITGSGPHALYPMSGNDSYVHLIVSIVLLVVGFSSKKKN